MITSPTAFWHWFIEKEKSFYNTVKTGDNVDENFLDYLLPKLQSLNPGFYCLTGMYNQGTAELVITAESDIKTFVFVEELVAAAPTIDTWRFTALTPPTGFDNTINMGDYRYNSNNIKFICKEVPDYPDEVALTMIHADFTEANKDAITSGTMLYLENALGELNKATLIDHIEVKGATSVNQQPIPIEKLEDFLLWKEKEFVEKYNDIQYPSEIENYSALEAKDKIGLPVIAIVNQGLMNWDAKASHPWMMVITIKYANGKNGMPDGKTSAMLNQIEEDLMGLLSISYNSINLGRKTYNGIRNIYFACKEFREISKTARQIISFYEQEMEVSYDIYKDKYWMTMNQFRQS